MDRRDQAHRQFLSAVKTLATVRNLVARTQTIQIELLNPPMAYTPAAPIMPMVGGEQSNTHSGYANGAKNRFGAEAMPPVNGVGGRINGHNCVSEVLVAAGAGTDG